MTDTEYMRQALALAEQAAAIGEVPVGCVIVCDDKIVGTGYNRRENDRHALAHAELMAIDEACRTLGGWRLWKCTLYVTLEPCPMCAGSMIMAELNSCVFGAYDPQQGCCGSVYTLPEDPAFFHRVKCTGGVLEKECAQILQAFFEKKRP